MTLPGPALFCPLLCAGGRIQALRTDIQTAILAIFSLQNGYEPESNGKALRMQLLERGMLAFKQASAGCACSPYAQYYTIPCLDSSSYMWPIFIDLRDSYGWFA